VTNSLKARDKSVPRLTMVGRALSSRQRENCRSTTWKPAVEPANVSLSHEEEGHRAGEKGSANKTLAEKMHYRDLSGLERKLDIKSPKNTSLQKGRHRGRLNL